MDNSLIQAISNEIYRQFPEVKGERPIIKSYGKDQVLLVYKGKVKTADGHSMPRTVRVVADGDGKIKKVSTSR
jgi:hypothetical protein